MTPVSADNRASVSGAAAGELIIEDLAGALELGFQRGVDLAVGGTDHRTAARHAALGLDLPVPDATELGHERLQAGAHELEVLGVDEHEHALALAQRAQGTAHGLEHAL